MWSFGKTWSELEKGGVSKEMADIGHRNFDYFCLLSFLCPVMNTRFCDCCLSNAMHSIGQNIKSHDVSVRPSVRATNFS